MPHQLLNNLLNFIREHFLFDPSQKILLAVSGGVDSMVMASLFKEAGLLAGIAHCNFQLREEESVRDENFVRNLAEKLEMPFHETRFDTEAYATSNKVSIQIAARELRYQWLEEIRSTNGYAYIATAHHLQDSVETALMNFVKGTGIAGLHGILPKTDKIIRPLLFAEKDTLLAWAARRQLTFVEDSSNATDKYTRNFFRHHVIPMMQESMPAAVKNMAASIEKMKEAEILYQEALGRHKKSLLTQQGENWLIPVLKLQKSVPLQTIAWEIFREFGCTSNQLPQVLNLLESESGRYVETSTHRVIRNRAWLMITPVQADESPVVAISEEQSHVHFGGGQLQFRTIEKQHAGSIPQSADVAWLDASQVVFPLILRKWKQGDYFYPLGMRKKKKLSRFFIDQKLSIPQKEQVWVLESQKRILWIVGMRIDDRAKVLPSTSEIISIQLQK
ncbi:tRNA lysidine(34) synthetase TilS [Chitinophaga sp. Cy-1792]|uniref:tRNA lysidine(34) synthetase TilS n=1 Tax=Chitinophaga sp. Cy-1792 TaxID=2608339 RepID=UPI00142370C4|nr:tRNA lysidine(34) synthetase TilS [Chitinophaga sp. Cy-1792]NIG56258.1 tRNA lysidine(34) synthetase TilS [Chitinophaga sp. Cy-1792]